ncbi:MAG: hypothetical protein JW395_0941 [Nitrospira sp.]|nr:hypothetical protein [Nitrospira sp.]
MLDPRVIVERDEPESAFDFTGFELAKKFSQTISHALNLTRHATRSIQDEHKVDWTLILRDDDDLLAMRTDPTFSK